MLKSPLGKPVGEEAAPPEQRAAPFVDKPNPKAVARVNREMRQRMYLMGKMILGHERNPSGVEFYVMGEIGKIFTVKIREFPSCQCGDFLLTRFCRHLAFVSLRVLRFQSDDPLIWQKALLPSELKRVILNPSITPVKPKSKFKRLRQSFSMGNGPHDILEHAAMYCPVCCEEVNFFEEEVYEREESLLEELYEQNLDKKVKQIKAKLDMGTPKSMLDKDKKDAAADSPPAVTDAPAASPSTPPTGDPLSSDAARPAEGDAAPAEGQSAAGATDAPVPPSSDGGETATVPASPPGAAGAAVPGDEAKPAEEAKVGDGLVEPRHRRPYEPLLFCPQKSCEFEGCVKVVHRYCWLRWGRFQKVDWTLPNIVIVNNCFPLASSCK